MLITLRARALWRRVERAPAAVWLVRSAVSLSSGPSVLSPRLSASSPPRAALQFVGAAPVPPPGLKAPGPVVLASLGPLGSLSQSLVSGVRSGIHRRFGPGSPSPAPLLQP